MKKFLKRIALIIIIVAVIAGSSYLWGHSFKHRIDPDLNDELREYCVKNGLCNEYCIVVDFSIYSGKDRLFIIDMDKNEIVYSALCAHGIGKKFDCSVTPRFSNENGSNLSSLGHFKLDRTRKTSQYDLNAIELYGLDSINSNAYLRGILIHDGLPDVRIIGLPCLPLSQGCFTISSKAFNEINELKSRCNKPVMIYSTDKSVF
ncbi:MAG: murein L,D-transpeptidase catalytic domain family protein [Duncaniella sp.]|nr:murein L,D-transpeptidase catalytic domain family protein [Duncaniella sp.]